MEVTHLRIRLERWREFPATVDNDYPAEAIKNGEKFYSNAKGLTIPITEQEYRRVIGNPYLYYFSTALRLHQRITCGCDVCRRGNEAPEAGAGAE